MKQIQFNQFVDGLRKNKPYSFARYGDGEWLPILGQRIDSYNADKSQLTESLGRQLRQVVNTDLPYWHGLLTIANKECGRENILNFLNRHTTMKNWYRGDSLLDGLLKEQFKPLINEIRQRNVLYVGGEHLKGLNQEFFEYKSFITVPPRNSYTKRANALELVKLAIETKKIDFIGYSAGMFSNLLIDDVFKIYPHIFQIDFGSCFDGFFGRIERSYAKKVDWNELKEKTL